MKIGKFIKTITYAPRIIPIKVPEKQKEEEPIPIELPKREPAVLPEKRAYETKSKQIIKY
jgi:hypothetical protein